MEENVKKSITFQQALLQTAFPEIALIQRVLKEQPMESVKIIMLGPSRVGKTSLLVTMYEHANQAMVGKRIEFKSTMSELSEKVLKNREEELKSVAEGGEFNSTADMGISATQSERTFSFSLGETGEMPFLQLDFIDYPGRNLSSMSEELRELVCTCSVILIVIDAAALMPDKPRRKDQNKPGKWNDMINMPHKIAEMIRESFRDRTDPRLVLLVPLKCEKYIQDHQFADSFLPTIKNAYEELLTFLASDSQRPHVAVAITPVQSLGNVIFNHIEEQNQRPHFFFQKLSRNVTYKPSDGEQPLRYLLQFLLKLRYAQQSQSWGIFNFLRQLFQLDKNMRLAAEEFSSQLKYEHNAQFFQIIQGHQWLGLPS